MNPLVVGLGQCSLDTLGEIAAWPEPDSKVELGARLVQGGGPVATALVTLARLGVATAFVGRVGDDTEGAMIRAGLQGEQVETDHLLTLPGSSQTAFIAVEAATGRRTIFWTRGSARPLTAAEVPPALVQGARLLLLDGLQLEASLAAAGAARRAGVVTVLDGGTLRPGLEQLLPLIDHPVVSARFAAALAKDPQSACVRLLAFGATAATVTRGERGSVTLTAEGRWLEQPAFPVAVVDTTGCGDVFHGGYLYGLLKGWPLTRTLAFAAACAALKTRDLGGRTAIPTLAEVDTFLQEKRAVR